MCSWNIPTEIRMACYYVFLLFGGSHCKHVLALLVVHTEHIMLRICATILSLRNSATVFAYQFRDGFLQWCYRARYGQCKLCCSLCVRALWNVIWGRQTECLGGHLGVFKHRSARGRHPRETVVKQARTTSHPPCYRVVRS